MTELDPAGSIDWETFDTEWAAIATELKTILAANGATATYLEVDPSGEFASHGTPCAEFSGKW